MPRRALAFAILLAMATGASAGSFTYRGQLAEEGRPADGGFDLQFRFYADASGKRLLTGPIELLDVAVREGAFAVALELPETEIATAWLEVAVRPVGEVGYWPLASKEAVSLKAGACPTAWELGGNAGTQSTFNFLGTTDSQALELRTANTRSMRIEPSSQLFNGVPITSNLVGGSNANVVSGGVRGATLSGGGSPGGAAEPLFASPGPNRITDHYGVVAGGLNNQAGNANGNVGDATNATVGGGRANVAFSQFSTIGGGSENSASGQWSTISGGANHIALGNFTTVAGGFFNQARGPSSAIGGGNINFATGEFSVVPGGIENCAGGNGSFAAGNRAKALPAFNPGGGGPCAGLAGYTGTAHSGTFVWADYQLSDFESTGPDQFLIRARGGVGINAPPIADAVELSITADADDSDFANLFLRQRTNAAGILISAGGASSTAGNNAGFFLDHFNQTGAQGRRLELRGDGVTVIRSNITGASSGVIMASGSGAWSSLSDRRLKTAIASVDPLAVLERLVDLPIARWSYIAQGEAVRHIGPMAQDFAAAFGVGENDTSISTIDADGVALAAIQGLNAKLERENAALREELAALRAMVEGLQRPAGR